MNKRRTKIPPVDADCFETIRKALGKIEESSGRKLAKGGVALDNLAGALRAAYLPSDSSSREALTLYEVIDQLAGRFTLSDDLLEASDKLEQMIEDTYDFDDDDETEERVKEWADELVSELRKIVVPHSK